MSPSAPFWRIFTVEDPSTEYWTCEGSPPPTETLPFALSAGNSGQHSQWTRGCAAVVYGEVGDLLEILGVTDGAVFGVNHRTAFTADFDGLLRGCKFEGHVHVNSRNPYEALRTS
jgi:hypothetical protein